MQLPMTNESPFEELQLTGGGYGGDVFLGGSEPYVPGSRAALSSIAQLNGKLDGNVIPVQSAIGAFEERWHESSVPSAGTQNFGGALVENRLESYGQWPYNKAHSKFLSESISPGNSHRVPTLTTGTYTELEFDETLSFYSENPAMSNSDAMSRGFPSSIIRHRGRSLCSESNHTGYDGEVSEHHGSIGVVPRMLMMKQAGEGSEYKKEHLHLPEIQVSPHDEDYQFLLQRQHSTNSRPYITQPPASLDDLSCNKIRYSHKIPPLMQSRNINGYLPIDNLIEEDLTSHTSFPSDYDDHNSHHDLEDLAMEDVQSQMLRSSKRENTQARPNRSRDEPVPKGRGGGDRIRTRYRRGPRGGGRKLRDYRCQDHPDKVFKNQSEFKKHMQTQHTRPFTCAFHFAGCEQDFGSKNEWKRHVESQHLKLRGWVCDNAYCKDRKAVFDRKDLFGQHLKRMHVPNKPKRQLSSTDRAKVPDDLKVEFKLIQERCIRERRPPPQSSCCIFCPKKFDGPDSWDKRMEHVGKHYEEKATREYHEKKGGTTAIKVTSSTFTAVQKQERLDEGLIKWAIEQRIIEPADEDEDDGDGSFSPRVARKLKYKLVFSPPDPLKEMRDYDVEEEDQQRDLEPINFMMVQVKSETASHTQASDQSFTHEPASMSDSFNKRSRKPHNYTIDPNIDPELLHHNASLETPELLSNTYEFEDNADLDLDGEAESDIDSFVDVGPETTIEAIDKQWMDTCGGGSLP